MKPALALSLHTTKPALREQLLPRAPRLTPRELVDHAEHYARLTGYPVQFQWTLLEGVNDGDDEMDGIVELLKGKHAVLNMIPYNTIPDLAFKRPSWERARALAAALHQRGVLTKLRDSAGQDVDGGCGQLRARASARAAFRSDARNSARDNWPLAARVQSAAVGAKPTLMGREISDGASNFLSS